MKFDRCEICDFSELDEVSSGYNQKDYEGKNKVRQHGGHMFCDDCNRSHVSTMRSFKEDKDDRGS